MQAFVSLFNATEYPEYIKDPFISQKESTLSIPKLAANNTALARKNDAIRTQIESRNTNPSPDIPTMDTPLSQIQKIFGNIPQEQITRETDGFRITNAAMSISSKDSQLPIFFTISFKTSLDLSTVSELKIVYEGRNIIFSRNQYLTKEFVSFLS